MSSVALKPERGSQPTAQTSPALSGVWVAVAAITMSFAAFTSSLIIRQASGNDWRHLALPGILYLNTVVLLASSLTVELARRKGISSLASMRSWLHLTFTLGAAFLAGQTFAWHQLRTE